MEDSDKPQSNIEITDYLKRIINCFQNRLKNDSLIIKVLEERLVEFLKDRDDPFEKMKREVVTFKN